MTSQKINKKEEIQEIERGLKIETENLNKEVVQEIITNQKLTRLQRRKNLQIINQRQILKREITIDLTKKWTIVKNKTIRLKLMK